MGSTRKFWWGGVLVVLGVLFLLDNIGVLAFREVVHTYWPLLLVILGLFLLRRQRIRTNGAAPAGSDEWNKSADERNAPSPAEELQSSSILGGLNLRVTSSSFKGGSVSTVIGDLMLDLTGAGIAEGEHRLKLSSVIGDVEVRLPKGAAFAVSANALLGSVRVNEQSKDGFSSTVVYETPEYSSAPKRLRLAVSQVLGDINVES
jgi:lia operon protein LiaF